MSKHQLLIREFGTTTWREVDLSTEETPIQINRRLSDLEKVGQARSASAYNITLLGTPRTLDALDHGHRFDKLEKDSLLNKKFEAIYTYDGVDPLQGPAVLQINQNAVRRGEVTFSCYLTAGRNRAIQDLKDVFLQDLDLGTHIFDITTVEASQDKANGREYIHGVYMPIDYGAWIAPPRIQLVEYEFSLYFKSVVEKAFELVGWDVEGGDYWDNVCEWFLMPHVGTLVHGSSFDDGRTRPISYDIVQESFGGVLPDEIKTGCPGVNVPGETNRGRWVLVSGTEINCTAAPYDYNFGLVRFSPPDDYPGYNGPASAQFRFQCSSDGGTTWNNVGQPVTIDVEFASYESREELVDARMKVPLLGEVTYEEGDKLIFHTDYYEVQSLEDAAPYLDSTGNYVSVFDYSPNYGLKTEGEYTVPFDGSYQFTFNFDIPNPDLTTNWVLDVVSDKRGIVDSIGLLGAGITNSSTDELFFNKDEQISLVLRVLTGTGTEITLSNVAISPGTNVYTLDGVTPAMELAVSPKVSINGDAGSNFYDDFLNGQTIVASHAFKNFNVLEAISAFQRDFNMVLVPDTSTKTMRIYTEDEFTDLGGGAVIDVTEYLDCNAQYLENLLVNDLNQSSGDEAELCTNVKFRWKPDPADGWVAHYQEASGDLYLHGEKPDPEPACNVEIESTFFSPTALVLNYMGVDFLEVQYPDDEDEWGGVVGGVPAPREYVCWFLKMAPDRENDPDYYQLTLDLRKAVLNGESPTFDDISSDTLWEGRVTHDYNFRLVYYDGLRDLKHGDYFKDFFAAGNAIGVGFQLQYFDDNTQTYTSKVVTDIPYAFMVDFWGQNVSSPAMTYRKESYVQPALFTVAYAKFNTNYLITSGRTGFATNNLKAVNWNNTLRRYRGQRSFSFPINTPVSLLDSIFAFNTRKYLSQATAGSGVFYLDAITGYDPETGKGNAIMWKDEPSCDETSCYPNFTLFNFAANTVHDAGADTLTTTFTLDNTNTELDSIQSTIWGVVNLFDNSTIGTVSIDGATFLATGSQETAVITVGPGGDFPFNEFGERNVAFKITGAISYINASGTTCSYPFCYAYEARVSDVALEAVIVDQLSSSCDEPPATFTNYTCLQTSSGEGSFPHKSETDLGTSIESNYNTARRWEFGSMTINGASLTPENIGVQSTFWSNGNGNIDFILGDNTGAFIDTTSTLANNTRNFWTWFNSLFYSIGDDGNGLPTASESPIIFKPIGTRTLMYVSPNAGMIDLNLIRRDSLDVIEYYYDISINPATMSGTMTVSDVAYTQIAQYTIGACTNVADPIIPDQACQHYNGAILGPNGTEKWTNLTNYAGTLAGSLTYVVEHFEVDGGGNVAASESVTFNIPGDTILATSVYAGGFANHPTNLMDWFNALPYVSSSGYTFADGGTWTEYDSTKTYQILVREEVRNNGGTLIDTWQFLFDNTFAGTGTQFGAGLTDALFGTNVFQAFIQCVPLASLTNEAPVADTVELTGNMLEGELLGGNYNYTDNEADPEGVSIIEIFSYPSEADAIAFTNETLAGTSGYTLTAGDSGNFYRARVTPVATSGTLIGTPVYSDYEGPAVATPLAPITFQYDPANGVTINGFRIRQSAAGPIGIDWGDGTVDTVVAGGSVNIDWDHTATTGQLVPKTGTILAEADTITFLRASGVNFEGTLDLTDATNLNTLTVANNEVETINLPSAFTSTNGAYTISNETSMISNLDFSGFTTLPRILNVTNVTTPGIDFNPAGHANTILSFSLNTLPDVTTLDLSDISNTQGTFTVQNIPQLATLDLPTSSSGSYNTLRVRQLDVLAGGLELGFADNGAASILTDSNPLVTFVNYPDTTGTGVVTSQLWTSNSGMMVFAQLNSLEDAEGDFQFTNNTSLTQISGPNLTVTGGDITNFASANTPALAILQLGNFNSMSGTLDLNGATALTDANFDRPATMGPFDFLRFNDSGLGYINIISWTFDAAADIRLADMGMDANDTSVYLQVLENILPVAGTGSITLTGNTTPTAAGLVSVGNLQARGYTVNVDP